MKSSTDTSTKDILAQARGVLAGLAGHTLDVLEIAKPPDAQYMHHLVRVLSKLSPLVGNMIELSIVSSLNQLDWDGTGKWIRQDPGFPDTLFVDGVDPQPGIELKTWFPLATEITARFKDSVVHFKKEQIDVAVIAWLPSQMLYGKPRILDVFVDSAQSLAIARDRHYHHPPDYLVIEPEDTRQRTANLQQTNTNGYKFQGTVKQLKRAEREVATWGAHGQKYRPTPAYQQKVRQLLGRYPYRLDTNFAKIDRIDHAGLEDFKARVLSTQIHGHTVLAWAAHYADWYSALEV